MGGGRAIACPSRALPWPPLPPPSRTVRPSPGFEQVGPPGPFFVPPQPEIAAMTTPQEHPRAAFFFDAFISAGFGGSVVVLTLLLLDAVQGQPFQTPNILGVLLFTDLPATAAAPIQFDLVALATIAHFGAFAVLGLGVGLLLHTVRAARRNPLLLTLILLLATEVGIRVVSAIFAPGLVAAVGPWRILAANLAASATIAGILTYVYRHGLADPAADPAEVVAGA